MLSIGIAPQVVMKFTGHADYKSMKPYIDITEDAKKEASRRWKKCGMPNSSTLKKSAKKRK